MLPHTYQKVKERKRYRKEEANEREGQYLGRTQKKGRKEERKTKN